jgi:hypothetical protein
MELKGEPFFLVPLAAVALKGEVVEISSLVGHETLSVIAMQSTIQIVRPSRSAADTQSSTRPWGFEPQTF